MKKIWTYVPLFGFSLLLFLSKKTPFTLFLLLGLLILMLFAKYQRQKMNLEEVAYDDRINQLITRWSLRSLYGFHTLFLLLLFLQQQDVIQFTFSLEWMINYFIISLCVPFYLVPMIAKQF